VARLRDVVDAACHDVGRDPADIERTVAVHVRLPGGTGRLQGGYAEAGAPPLEGDPAAMADTLRAFAAEGIGHVQLVVDPITRASVDALVPVLRALDGG
jgi:alkanesulfonate monooxygenase SsuD/methylene tetrahydromethanopterin reductase-like flavin-dependent oxidoreductase (luciferase family)